MKKLNFVIFGTLLAISLATQAFAETTIPWTKEGCESVKGIWVTAHSATDDGCDAAHCNGLNFCRRKVNMNWFSALIWCKSIGHKLTDIETACPNGLASSETCANLEPYIPRDYRFGFWTSIPSTSAGYTWRIARKSSGAISIATQANTSTNHSALCTE